MAGFKDPYDPDIDLSGCGCGSHAGQHAHAAAADPVERSTDPEVLSQRFVESSLVRALFPLDATRRRFIQAVGTNTAMATISSVLPIGALTAMAQDKAPLEKKDLKI